MACCPKNEHPSQQIHWSWQGSKTTNALPQPGHQCSTGCPRALEEALSLQNQHLGKRVHLENQNSQQQLLHLSTHGIEHVEAWHWKVQAQRARRLNPWHGNVWDL